jgi:hypothetical protein
MQDTKFKYDVAFSLLAQDEGLASEINDLLSDRYQTFLYSERQKEIAGTDGEIKFKTLFAEEARFIVVLYRDGWGQRHGQEWRKKLSVEERSMKVMTLLNLFLSVKSRLFQSIFLRLNSGLMLYGLVQKVRRQ